MKIILNSNPYTFKMARNNMPTELSRFSVLKIEDDDEENNNNISNNSEGFATVGKSKKKPRKNPQQKKKKVVPSASDTSGQVVGLNPVAGQKQPPIPLAEDKPTIVTVGASKSKTKSPVDDEWKVWQDRDSTFVSTVYHHDLQAAIKESQKDIKSQKKLDKLKQVQLNIMKENEHESDVLTESSNSKKKKKKPKQQPADKKTMTLEEFHQLPEDVLSNSIPSSPEKNLSTNEVASQLTAAGKMFVNIEDDYDLEAIEETLALESAEAQAVLLMEKERRQAELKESFKADSNLRNLFKHELEKQRTKIKTILKELTEVKGECDEVKKRNKYLCRIMMQGEMKDKAELVREIDDLQQVKSELTEEISSLHIQLEKEKSENHKTKEEVKRLQKK